MKQFENIFNEYYSEKNFVDRFKSDNEAVDVIIPLINTNDLWKENLYSFYREIPINRLLIGDGGCTDDSLKIAKKFPRVEILNHHEFKSQGYSIKKLIEEVNTEWFIYLHADVFLPEEWYDIMATHKSEYDWFETYRKMTILFEYWIDRQNKADRAFSGSQMGRKDAFKNVVSQIDDDYLQRNEDIILAELIKAQGLKYGRVNDTFHYHQTMNKKGELEPNIKEVDIKKESDPTWEARIFDMQYKGLIKYLNPQKYLAMNANNAIYQSRKLNSTNWKTVKKWTKKTNKHWIPYLDRFYGIKSKLKRILEIILE